MTFKDPHQSVFLVVFFFNDPATTEIYTLSLHDALPIFSLPPRIDRRGVDSLSGAAVRLAPGDDLEAGDVGRDRKSTRLNSSHPSISYAVFCLKKKKESVHMFYTHSHSRSTPFTHTS